MKIVLLKVINGNGTGTIYKISGKDAVIGRSEDVDVALPEEKSLSRRHAAIEFNDDVVVVRDLDSQNGVFIDNRRVKEAQLSDGVNLKLGTLVFKVKIEDSEKFEVSNNPGNQALRQDNFTNPGMEEYVFDDGVTGGKKNQGIFVLLLVLVIFGLYFINWASTSGKKEAVVEFIIKRNEKLVLLLPGTLKGFKDNQIKVFGSEERTVIKWQRFDGLIGKTNTTNVIVVEGKAQGEVELWANDYSGSPVRKYKIFVRGVIPRIWDDKVMTKDQYERLALKKLEEAGILQKDQVYEAIVALEEASELLLRAGEGLRAEKADVRKKDLERELSLKVSRLYDEARTLISGGHGINTDLDAAAEKLSEIKRLVPDEKNIDWQLANLVLELIRR